MKKVLFIVLILLAFQQGQPLSAQAQAPDSVFLFSYATPQDKGRSGLHFAWSADKNTWNLIGNEYGYIKSDYGEWGSQKQMNSPYLFQDADGQWRCIWSLNESLDQFATAPSTNLTDWGRQRYPYLRQSQSFRQPVVHYNKARREYTIDFISGDQYLSTTTKDFKAFSPAIPIPPTQYKDDRVTVNLPAGPHTGNVSRVPQQLVDRLVQFAQEKQHNADQAREETPKNDSIRFAGLPSLTATVTLRPESRKPISDRLIGVFFEDINYAADGGLYAELLQNRDFEYTPGDRKYHDTTWNSKHSWTAQGLSFTIDSTAPLHPNNPHYAVLEATSSGGALINSGYDGIPVKKDEQYEFSVFARNPNEKSAGLLIKLVAPDGSILAQTTLQTHAQQWQKYTAKLTATTDASNARLELQMSTAGRLMVDMVSLFPKNTFKGRSNGMRADLAEAIAAIHPRFIRFPGGCVSHGDGLDNIYRWKNTIGPIEARKPQPNIWRYHQSVGLGFFEYFQYCEDIGAEPLPVIAAGVPCQNSSLTAKGGGQQGGIPMSEMDQYVQDILDLVEWANGPITSRWGKLRAASGHPAPFHLKYIGIGNEDLISDIFEERFIMIYKAIRQKHPEITVIGTVGPFYTGTDYEQGWALASQLKVPMVDEHYYESPGWFIDNQDFYDHYDRTKPKVYLGEYASHGNTLFNALSEALYLTSLERNGDVVQMASYAPLLARDKHTQWNPDLIYFSNTEIRPTVNYEVQKLFGNNAGNEYLPSTIQLSGNDQALRKRLGVSVVRDTTTNAVIVKMVNLLPLATSVKLDLGDLAKDRQAEKSVLQGLPNDKVASVTVTAAIPATNVLNETLPPYSLTIWRIIPFNASAELNRLLELDAAARQSGDSITRLKIALQVRELLNATGDGVLAVAHAYSVLKDSTKAFESLNDYARMGLEDKRICNGEDKKFTWLAGSRGLAAVCRIMESNTSPVSRSTRMLNFQDTGYLSEDIDYDRQSRTFLFTSVLRHAVYRLAWDGSCRKFASSPSGWPMMAIKIDQSRGLVWTTEMAIPGFGGQADTIKGRSAVCCFDLHSGQLKGRLEAPDGAQWGDMILDSQGVPIVCDGQSGAIFRLRQKIWERLDKGDFISPQTPTLTRDGKYLIVPDYLRGLAVMDIEKGSVAWVQNTPAIPYALNGVDGAYLVKNKLYLTQNGVNPERVLEVQLDSTHTNLTAYTLIERATPGLGEPTHGVVVNGSFYYIANSGWDALDQQGKIKPGARMTHPMLMRYSRP